MRGVLIGVAVGIATLSSAPSAAQSGLGAASFGSSSGASAQFTRGPQVRVHRGEGDWRRDRDSHSRRGNGDTYFPYRDYQGDTLWRPESFNDWWHERPERAYPAWMARNTNCERLWWSGGGWRC